jgi:Epoxide hydrolase N terminus
MSTTVETVAAIGPFQVDVPQERIDDLRRRIAATRWPTKELVADRSQGVQLAATQELARYWLDEYDFGRVKTRLNALPQFVTEIDGVDVHFIHVRSQHADALPLIMTHGGCLPCPATATPASLPSSAGTSAGSRGPGPS